MGVQIKGWLIGRKEGEKKTRKGEDTGLLGGGKGEIVFSKKPHLHLYYHRVIWATHFLCGSHVPSAPCFKVAQGL